MALTSIGWDTDPRIKGRLPLPALPSSMTADVCVVGLGASGLTAVGECLKRGLSVVGLDAGRAGEGAAGRNGGFLLAGPAKAIHDAAETMGVPLALAAYRRTLEQLDELTELLGPGIVERNGSLRIAGLPGDPEDASEKVDRERELADCEAQFQFMTEYGLSVERYDGPLGQGLFFPDDGQTNPAVSVLALCAIHGKEAQLFERTRALYVGDNKVVTAHGTVSAGLVIVAIDGRLEVLLPELSGRIRTARLQMMSTEPIADLTRLECPVYSRWGYDYAQQDASGRLFVGGGRDRFETAEWTQSDATSVGVQVYIRKVAERFAGGPVRQAAQWAASVGYTPDGRPIVARVRPDLIALGGYNGTGNLMGQLAARVAVAAGLDGVHPDGFFNTMGTL